jgi:hypothetical protein
MPATVAGKCDFCEFSGAAMLSFSIKGRMLAACTSILNRLAIALVVVDNDFSASSTPVIILSSYEDLLVALVNLNPDCDIAGCENVTGVGAVDGCSSSLYWLSELKSFYLMYCCTFPLK